MSQSAATIINCFAPLLSVRPERARPAKPKEEFRIVRTLGEQNPTSRAPTQKESHQRLRTLMSSFKSQGKSGIGAMPAATRGELGRKKRRSQPDLFQPAIAGKGGEDGFPP